MTSRGPVMDEAIAILAVVVVLALMVLMVATANP